MWLPGGGLRWPGARTSRGCWPAGSRTGRWWPCWVASRSRSGWWSWSSVPGILAATGGARAAGVRRGQRLRSAQALVAELEVYERSVDGEAKAFESVADAVGALAAHLEVLRPGLLAVPAAGAARFHGGEDVLAERVVDAVEATGHPCRVGIADGLLAAQLAARLARAVPAGGQCSVPGAVPGGRARGRRAGGPAGPARPADPRPVRRAARRLGAEPAAPAGCRHGRWWPAHLGWTCRWRSASKSPARSPNRWCSPPAA
ncbi:Y-family DNA polymerase [Kitasatospora sp. NPDC003701]